MNRKKLLTYYRNSFSFKKNDREKKHNTYKIIKKKKEKKILSIFIT